MAASVPVSPPFSASAIEEVCKVLGDAVTGDQIPNLIASLKVLVLGSTNTSPATRSGVRRT